MRVYARKYAREFKLAELSRPALISHPIKCVCEGRAQPTYIDATVICIRIHAYVHNYNSQRICAALGIAQRGAYARIRALMKSKSMNQLNDYSGSKVRSFSSRCGRHDTLSLLTVITKVLVECIIEPAIELGPRCVSDFNGATKRKCRN